MPEKRVCPFCNEQVGLDDFYCRQCGSDLQIHSAVEDDFEDINENEALKAIEAPRQVEDDFSELDYRPRERSGFLIPILVISLVLGMAAAVYLIMSNDEPAEVADNGPLEGLEQEEAGPEPEETEQEEAEDESEHENEEEFNEETDVEAESPDYDQLDAVLQEWLEQRLDDPEVILVHTAELDDLDQFYEEYNLDEDNIIFYEIESKGEEFAAVLFGLPFSEWSIKAIFHWRDGEWFILREEPII